MAKGKVKGTASGFDRYPGARSFEDNPVDSELFFGRRSETEEFLHKVLSNRLLVLFGKSGLGKTSMLQAGVFPRLREANYLPLKVRLNQTGVTPVVLLMEAVAEACAQREIDYTPGEAAGWWEFFKTASFWKGGNWLTPVLVLDQFEEMFTLQSAEGRRAIAEEIGQLAGGGMPGRVKQRRRDGEELPFSESPPEVKVVLSLREEYVGALQELFPEVPNILGERVRLAPMSREQAELAVVEPAVLPEPGFKTQPFRYAPDALDKLFGFLCGEEGDIEPFQLQVLCRHIEGQVSKRAREGEDLTVDGSYLGSRKEMEGILLGFYLSAIKKLSATKARRAARQLCENDLLSKDGHRESMSGRRIRQEYGLDEGQLDILVDARLLRKEPRLGDFGYELTHDSLTRPVMQNRPFRLPSRLWYTIGGLVGVILLVATLVSWQQYQIAEMAREGAEKQRDAADLARTEAERQAQLAEERRQEAETAKKNEEQRSKLTAEKYTDLLDRYKETGTKTERLQMEKEQLKQEIKQALASTNEQRDKKLAALRKKNDQLGNENEQLIAELEGLRERAQQLIDKNTQLVQAQSAEQVQTLQTQIRLLQDQLNQGPGTGPEQTALGIPVPEMVQIPAGEFMMGSSKEDPGAQADEAPRHRVRFKKPFWIGKHEVSFEEYDTFAIATGRQLPGDEGWGRKKRPVINVSWRDAQAYTEWLSRQTGQSYRLPTEAEWEYAARAGTTGPFSFDGPITTDKVNYDGNYTFDGSSEGIYRKETVPVGSLPANPWGLHEVHGNVWEWTQDCWHDSYKGALEDGGWTAEGDCKRRSVRGGSWFDNPGLVRAAHRFRYGPDFRVDDIGFRVVRSSPISR